MKCPNCETENRDGAKFCDECGFPLKGAIARTAAIVIPDGDEMQPESVVSDDNKAPLSGGSYESASEAVCETVDNDVSENVDEKEEPGNTQKSLDYSGGEAPDEGAPRPSEEIVEPIEETDDVEKTNEASELNQVDEFDEFDDVPSGDYWPDEYTPEATTVIKADLAGFDNHVDEYGERLVSSEYRTPEQSFRDGGTMQMPRVGGDDAPKRKDYLASSTKERKKPGKIIVIAIVAALVIAAVAIFGTYQMQLWGGKVVPDVVGMTEADARSVLADQGFEVRSELVKSDDTEGLVLIMDPSAGSRTDKGSEVTIHIASTRTIPDIVGKKKDEAVAILSEAGYENVKFEEVASDKAKGTVLSVDPKPGERSKSTAEITVQIAKPYTVPDVSGKDLADAIKLIENAGLKYESVDYETSEYPEGAVVSTDPAAGTEVKKGDYIVIYVAQARGAKLEGLVEEQLAEGSTIESGGKSYIIESVDSVAYLGNNTVSYTATGREYMLVFGQTVSSQQTESISGTVVFNDDDEIIAVS